MCSAYRDADKYADGYADFYTDGNANKYTDGDADAGAELYPPAWDRFMV